MKKKDDDKLNHASHRRVEGESLVYEAGTRRRSPHSGGPWNFTVRSAPGGIRPTAWRSMAGIKQNGILGQLLRDSWLASAEHLV